MVPEEFLEQERLAATAQPRHDFHLPVPLEVDELFEIPIPANDEFCHLVSVWAKVGTILRKAFSVVKIKSFLLLPIWAKICNTEDEQRAVRVSIHENDIPFRVSIHEQSARRRPRRLPTPSVAGCGSHPATEDLRARVRFLPFLRAKGKGAASRRSARELERTPEREARKRS
jgi:hypothetical protein